MKEFINSFHKTEAKSTSLWKWKGETVQKIDTVVLGPGVGAGMGCGVGLGLGVVGGAGLGGTSWNQLRVVFGIGIGCGAGVGVGYGQGFGGGFSLECLRSHLFDSKPRSKKRVRV